MIHFNILHYYISFIFFILVIIKGNLIFGGWEVHFSKILVWMQTLPPAAFFVGSMPEHRICGAPLGPASCFTDFNCKNTFVCFFLGMFPTHFNASVDLYIWKLERQTDTFLKEFKFQLLRTWLQCIWEGSVYQNRKIAKSVESCTMAERLHITVMHDWVDLLCVNRTECVVVACIIKIGCGIYSLKMWVCRLV